jgi:hypothetical protein
MKKCILLLLGTFLFIYGTNAQTTIPGGYFAVDRTLTLANSPYVLTGSQDISNTATITIEKGVEIRFNSDVYLQVFGTLNAKGVKFTANNGSTAKGYWRGLYVSYEGTGFFGNINLDSCTVEYAGNIYVRKGTLTLRKTTLDNFSEMGLRLYAQGTLNITETTIKNCNYPLHLNGPGIIKAGTGNVLTGNANNTVYLQFQDIPGNFYMPDLGIPYRCDYMRVTETGNLLISPGAKLWFVNCEFTVQGKIKALGTIAKPITFDMHPGVSYWLGINMSASSIDTACIFKNCIIQNANYDYEWHCALDINASSPTFENCILKNNCRNLNVTGISKPVFTNCVFNPSTILNGEAYNIGIDMNANVDFSTDSIKFNNKEIRAVKILGSTVIDNGNLKKLKFKNLDNPAYCMYDNTIVHDTASLVIDPGVVIKCRNYTTYLMGNGTITGIGTEAEPIIFTHLADDNFGNPKDSQNDGQQAISNSNSGRLMLYSKNPSSKIKNWKIHYGGYDSNNWAVYVSNGNIVENCEIKNSYRGVYFYDNAQLLNNAFVNINYYPVGRYLTQGNPVLLGNTVSSVGYIGIFIAGIAADSPTLKSVDFAGFTNVAYLVDYDLNIAAGNVLTIEPGVVIKFYQYGKLTVNGALKANGKKDNKIILTSYNDDSASGDTNNNGTASVAGNGDWGGIDYNGTASDVDNVLKNAEVRYCGQWYYGRSSAVQITDCKVTMDSILINFSNVSALSIFGYANPVLKNSQLYNLGNTPIYMDLFSNPTFTGNKVANLPRIGLRIRGGAVEGTVPVRSFAGYDNITYIIEESMSVPNTKELIIPEGLTFKGSGVWHIRGKLNIKGTVEKPVVFTTQEDDTYGNPKDLQQNGQTGLNNTGNYFIFYDDSDDLSTISQAMFRYSAAIPIQTTNASPKILNTTFQNIAFEGVLLSGSSKPIINNCTFNNITFPFRTSLVTYPAETTGNVISGTTGRAVRITDETLTMNVKLLKRAFADKANIPYVFGNYTVGSGAVLTISPGVVCKFVQNGYLSVYNGLIAKGGSSTDSTIVFTAVTDDFYGGDTYNDGDANLPSSNYWKGIYINNESIDENCILENCIIKNASDIYYSQDYPPYDAYRYGALSLDNASPTIKNCLFESNYYGITCRNTSLPKITNCDFVGTNPSWGYGVWNMTSTNTVTAENCWWNNNTGPKNATGNPAGLGERVSDNVDFTPWATQLAKPVLGDVSMNGEVKPFDAALVLQHSVASIVLTSKQRSVADVSGNNKISAYDASLILQYSVGIISKFDPEPLGTKSAVANEYVAISFPSLITEPNKMTFEIPLTVSTFEGVKAVDMKYSINQEHVKFLNVNKNKIPSGISLEAGFDAISGEVIIAMASAYDLNLDNQQIVLEFEFADSGISESMFSLNTVMANDNILANGGTATIIGKSTTTGLGDLSQLSEPVVFTDNDGIHTKFNLSKSNQNLFVQVFDVTGRILYRKTFMNLKQGMQYIDMPYSDFENPGKGICILNLKAGDFSISKKLLLK